MEADQTRRNPIDRVLERLSQVSRENGGFKALCPAHNDINPSLKVDEADNGDALLKCFAGCAAESIVQAIGLKMSDLFAADNVRPLKPKKRVAATYDYVDENGELVHQTVRYDRPSGESGRFSQRRPDGNGGWIWSLKGIEPLLYRLPEVIAARDAGRYIFVCEGEKDADNARKALGITATCNPMGAAKWRTSHSEALRGAHVAIIPDNDEAGRKHVELVAERLVRVAASVKIVELPGLGDKGDLSDWIERGGSRTQLEDLVRATEIARPAEDLGARNAHVLGERVLLGKMIREGIEPPVHLEKDVLIEGAVHWLYGASESGKTWLALYLIKRQIEAGETVIYFDKENGPEIVGERLEELGCDPERLDEHLIYREEPNLVLREDVQEAYTQLLDDTRPVLMVFDSARGFLTSAGLEENSNDDLDKWYEFILKAARNRRVAVVVLDHIPKDGVSARGAGRKRDLADVMWSVKATLPFDQENTGTVRLTREKGRRGGLPEHVVFSVGGGESGFVFERSAGTFEPQVSRSELSDKEKVVLTYLEEVGDRGASWAELLHLLHGAKSTCSRITKKLMEPPWNLVRKHQGRYYANGPMEPKPGNRKPETSGSTEFHSGSTEPTEPGVRGGGSTGSTTLKGGTMEPPTEGAEPTEVEHRLIDQLVYQGMSRKEATKEVLRDREGRE